MSSSPVSAEAPMTSTAKTDSQFRLKCRGCGRSLRFNFEEEEVTSKGSHRSVFVCKHCSSYYSEMFRRKDLWRNKPNLVNFFCSTNIVRCDKSDHSSKILNNVKNEKNYDSKRKKPVLNKSRDKSSSDKIKLYSSSYTDAEKSKARQKLENLIKDMKETGTEKWDETITTKEVKVAQSNKNKSQIIKSKLADFDFEKTLIKSAEEVAGEFGGDLVKTKSDILKTLRSLDILKEEKVDKERFQRNFLPRSKYTNKRFPVKNKSPLINDANKIKTKSDDILLWTEELGIFQKKDQQQQESSTEVKLKMWDKLIEDELRFFTCSPPRNYFEQLIMWTQEGKLWHFPIDNHQDLEEEAQVDFTEHIFLEDYLEPWCPQGGPLRHFMELVLMGLSKNPFLTVQDKKEHIYWFRDYFESKKKLLKELGTFASTKELEEPKEDKEK